MRLSSIHHNEITLHSQQIQFISLTKERMLAEKGQRQRQRATRLERYLFSYSNKLDISIHFSLVSKYAIRTWRVLALLALSLRFWLILFEESTSLFQDFQYLTVFGFMLSWLYFSLVCCDFLINHICVRVVSPGLPDWVGLCFEVVWCIEFPITILYWLILYSPGSDDGTQLIKDIGVHGFPLFCLLVDFIFNVYQFPNRHLPVVLGVGLFYLVINLVYSVEVNLIYTPIDWVSLSSYIWVGMALLIVVGVHLISRLIWVRFRRTGIENSLQSRLLRSGISDYE